MRSTSTSLSTPAAMDISARPAAAAPAAEAPRRWLPTVGLTAASALTPAAAAVGQP